MKLSTRLSICAILSVSASLIARNFTVEAIPPIPTGIVAGGTQNAFYTVTNNSEQSLSDYFITGLPVNVTQNTASNSYCGSPLSFAPHGQSGDSCTLKLDITGPTSGGFLIQKGTNITVFNSEPLNVVEVSAPDVAASDVTFTTPGTQNMQISTVPATAGVVITSVTGLPTGVTAGTCTTDVTGTCNVPVTATVNAFDTTQATIHYTFDGFDGTTTACVIVDNTTVSINGGNQIVFAPNTAGQVVTVTNTGNFNWHNAQVVDDAELVPHTTACTGTIGASCTLTFNTTGYYAAAESLTASGANISNTSEPYLIPLNEIIGGLKTGNPYILGSPDAQNWTDVSLVGGLVPTGLSTINGAAWSSSLALWVAVGNGILTSPDAYIWTGIPTQITTVEFDDVIWASSKFVATGRLISDGTPVIYTSPNGTSWTLSYTGSVASAAGSKIAWNGVKFVAQWAFMADTLIVYSTGGTPTPWTTTSTSFTNYSMHALAGTIGGRAPADSILVTGGLDTTNGHAYIAYSANSGVLWTAATLTGGPFTETITSMACNNGLSLFVAGTNITGHVFTSANGITWTHSTVATSTAAFDNITYSPAASKFIGILAGSPHNPIYTSSDGIMWTAATLQPTGSYVLSGTGSK